MLRFTTRLYWLHDDEAIRTINKPHTERLHFLVADTFWQGRERPCFCLGSAFSWNSVVLDDKEATAPLTIYAGGS